MDWIRIQHGLESHLKMNLDPYREMSVKRERLTLSTETVSFFETSAWIPIDGVYEVGE